jgi:hypothetical protein
VRGEEGRENNEMKSEKSPLSELRGIKEIVNNE